MAMVGERVRVDQFFKSKTSIVDIHILVVDDDATSLAIVSAMLRTWKYEVMSADDVESVILRSLECGVAFYIVKPVSPKDLKNVLQYAVAAKRGKFITIEEIINIPAESSVVSFEDQKSAASSVSQEKHSKKDSKRKGAPKMEKEDENEMNQGVPKRAKLVWTNSLHCRFLEAINHIGLRLCPRRFLRS